MERLGLSEVELRDILDRYRQSFNLGAKDLARLIGAAEMQAATHRTNPMVAEDIMSRNLVTIRANVPLIEVADLFSQHRFTGLPVVDTDNRYLGVIFQIHLIARASQFATLAHRPFRFGLRRMIEKNSDAHVCAAGIMASGVPRAIASAPLANLLPLMTDGDVDAVPILKADNIVGIVTRTDLISALARSSLKTNPQ